MDARQRLKVVLATRNKDKIREIKQILRRLNIDVLTLDQFPHVPEVIEDGKTIEENAFKKAKVVSDATQLLVLADDTGLEVDYLDGQPGVHSSRFAGERATYDDNCKKLLDLMEGVDQEQRTARFRCIIAIVGPGIEKQVEGTCEGFITDEKRGTKGFGYDPVFYVPKYDQTFAEMSLTLKNKISHRGLALKQARKILHQMIEG
jgi:XTP/dITP diphosphohydrolase